MKRARIVGRVHVEFTSLRDASDAPIGKAALPRHRARDDAGPCARLHHRHTVPPTGFVAWQWMDRPAPEWAQP